MKKRILFFALLSILILAVYLFFPKKSVSPESQFRVYCSGCHLAPDPANIPKPIWEDRILPEMAARLGYKYNNYDPFAKHSMEENLYIKMSKAYPEKPVIDSISWQQIHDYILAHAPDSIPNDILRSNRNSGSAQFETKPLSLDGNEIATITCVEFEDAGHQFVIGDASGKLNRWPEPADTIPQFHSPVVAYHQKNGALYVTEIGFMNPSEIPLGTIYRIRPGSIDTLVQKLHRPVYTEIVDLNDDGVDEILICEFGNLTGELSMLVNSGSHFEKRTLLPVPGTIKFEIADMNGDGIKDIVVLASQGNEGVFILYQKNDLEFKVEQAIRMEPEYGSSWFELADYNADHHLDIVLVNGDNADYSNFLKPYHGVRLFLNDGKNGFEEKWFYPIYGATRVLADDYDLDGDLDFAVLAFFPDFGNSIEEGFVLLQNKDSQRFIFEPNTFPEASMGRWLVMDKGDFDQDGDVDILLGSFIRLSLGKEYKSIMNGWRNDKADLLLLENKANN